jgi:hypothetical protein
MAKVSMSILTPLDEESWVPFNVRSFKGKETKIKYSGNWGVFSFGNGLKAYKIEYIFPLFIALNMKPKHDHEFFF